MKKGFTEVIVILLLTLLLIGGYFVYMKYYSLQRTNSNRGADSILTPSTSSPATGIKFFKSDSLNFSINVPSNYGIKEKSTRVDILSPEGEGIYVMRGDAGFDNVDDYVENLSSLNKFTLKNRERIKLNGLDTITGLNGKEKIYFVFADGWIYSVFTQTESLYDDLDQIAQSFRYTP